MHHVHKMRVYEHQARFTPLPYLFGREGSGLHLEQMFDLRSRVSEIHSNLPKIFLIPNPQYFALYRILLSWFSTPQCFDTCIFNHMISRKLLILFKHQCFEPIIVRISGKISFKNKYHFSKNSNHQCFAFTYPLPRFIVAIKIVILL